MDKYIIAVQSNPTEGNEDAYNVWYNDTHLKEILQVPGFTAAQRFQVDTTTAGEAPKYRYLAIYEVESDNPAATFETLGEAAADGSIAFSDAIDIADISAVIYKPISEKVLEEPVD